MPRGGRNGADKVYSEELAEEILERLADGEPLAQICRDAHMPSEKAVRLWAMTRTEDSVGSDGVVAPAFAPRYARARQIGVERLADEVITIGDASIIYGGEPNNALVQQARLACENRKWLLSKLLPHQFGDKVTAEIVGDSDRPLVSRIELVPVAPIRRQVEGKIIDHDEGSE